MELGVRRVRKACINTNTLIWVADAVIEATLSLGRGSAPIYRRS